MERVVTRDVRRAPPRQVVDLNFKRFAFGKVITPVRLVNKGKRKDGSGKKNRDEKAKAPFKEELGKSNKWAVGTVWRMFLGNPFVGNG